MKVIHITRNSSNYWKQAVVAMVCAIAVVPGLAQAQAADCDFSRSLYTGVSAGQDIKCLQEYLNDSGYNVASNGAGSPGNETTIYAGKTKAAVLRWQLDNDVAGANGVFGPASRTLYQELTRGTDNSSAAGNSSSDTNDSTPIDTSGSISTVVTNTLIAVENAQNILADTDNVSDDARGHMDKAFEALFNMLFAMMDDDDSDVIVSAAMALDRAEKAQDAIRNDDDDDEDDDDNSEVEDYDEDEDGAEDAISDAEELLEDLEEEVEEAEDDDIATDEAEDLLEEAEEKLEEAEDEFDDENWDDAVEAAQEAIEYAHEGEDELADAREEEDEDEGRDYDEDEDGAEGATDDAISNIDAF
jgi:peptidoglycan hydrolase-like protein with peptidoglycan-binding domain/HEPN domain-containing protein